MIKLQFQTEKFTCFNCRSGNLGGPAAKFHGDKLGLYVSTESKRNGRKVYRHEGDGGADVFLHFNDWGLGLVSEIVLRPILPMKLEKTFLPSWCLPHKIFSLFHKTHAVKSRRSNTVARRRVSYENPLLFSFLYFPLPPPPSACHAGPSISCRIGHEFPTVMRRESRNLTLRSWTHMTFGVQLLAAAVKLSETRLIRGNHSGRDAASLSQLLNR